MTMAIVLAEKGCRSLATFFPRGPVFVAFGEPKLPPKPGIPSHVFPRSPVLLFWVFAPAPQGAKRPLAEGPGAARGRSVFTVLATTQSGWFEEELTVISGQAP